MNRTVLAVAAHPDDIEFLMSGTLMHLAKAGFQIHYWNLANGCYGSDQLPPEEIASVRRLEAMESCQKLGATFHESICDDLGIFYDQATLLRVSSVIRAVEPSIILTHSLPDYMEDHMNTARLVVTGAFSRAMKFYPVEPPLPSTSQPLCLYHAQPYTNLTPLKKMVVPDLFVDTEDLIERKQELLACHKSQKDWLDVSQGVDSYLTALAALDRSVGELSGRFSYAEGWRQHLHMGFAGDEDNFLLDALSAVPSKPDSGSIVFYEE